MRVDSMRVLNLPLPPQEAWRRVSTPAGLCALVPELDDAFLGQDGQLYFTARFGRRRRTWRATTTRLDPGSRWEIASRTPGVPFQLVATVQSSGAGSELRIALTLEPPDHWLSPPRHRLARDSGPLERLLLSAALFALSTAGLLLLPRVRLPAVVAALAYALLGALFLAAISTLTGAHRTQQLRVSRRARAMIPSNARIQAPQ